MKLFNLSLLLLVLCFVGCKELPPISYDNPYDPNNETAPLNRPTGMQVIFRNDSLFDIIWTDENLVVSGYKIERKSKLQSTFSLLSTNTKKELDSIVVSSTLVYRIFHDIQAKKADSLYVYRVKVFHSTIESAYSDEFTVRFP